MDQFVITLIITGRCSLDTVPFVCLCAVL